MRVCRPLAILSFLCLGVTNPGNKVICEAKKSSGGGGRSMPSRHSRTGSSNYSKQPYSHSRSSKGRREPEIVDEYDATEDEEDQFDLSDQSYEDDEEVCDAYGDDQSASDDYDDHSDDYDDFRYDRERSRQRRSSSRSSATKTSSAPRANQSSRPPRTSNRASRSSQKTSSTSSRRMVSQKKQHPTPSAFSRGLTAFRESIPSATTLKDTAISSISNARQTTTRISSSIYREVKTLSSSELEQAFLKATVPNDLPAKEKHVERLVMITYQVSASYNIFEVVLRKLWNRMIERDWRTTIKAVYVLHRFGTDGSPQQQMALKTMLREMRRTKDPKRKATFFNMKQLLECDTNPTNVMFRAFLARYAHYVLLRVQCFGGMFVEIDPSLQKSSPTKSPSSRSQTSSSKADKPITSTHLKKECLDAAKLVLKAGLACKLKSTEKCENTVVALERVTSDMIGLTAAVASALTSTLSNDNDKRVDKELVKLWCEFYAQELLPQTKAMVKSSTPTLDEYGIFLPSRVGKSVAQDLLQKGLTYTPQATEVADKNGESPKKDEAQELHENEGMEGEDEGGLTVSSGKESSANGHTDENNSGNQNSDNNEDRISEEEDENMDEDISEYDEYVYDEYYDGEAD